MHRLLLARLLANHVPDCDVFLFGSRTRGDARPNADIDLCLRGAGPIQQGTLESLHDALSESDLPYLVDLNDWYRLDPEFRNRIQMDWVLFQLGEKKTP